jgi:hypothetical protein
MSDPKTKVIKELDSLSKLVVSGLSGTAKPWQGADVVVTNVLKLGDSEIDSFYPSPRFVITDHVEEVSWLFEKLARIFANEENYGAWKEEFFGRLGNMANRVIGSHAKTTIIDIQLAILHEAYAIFEEIQSDTHNYLLVTSGNTIYDDLISRAVNSGSVSLQEAEIFFKSKGLIE